ncbi:pentatricopeptide repeat-containing protein At1g74600, chloroplastic [Telopea speciosissima]|uniref:pentatricopeptide repeat-containing protein At1g74600, chloroplastic n=1 Tax=Telopea speciosissima TaxID=54955 RepID=UPI001CC48211|nr:pentatricopeptide repeat-containing protein At1g74600, chloroplastic [Telopea speciosissima]
MSSLIHRTFQAKTSIPSLRFISALAVVDDDITIFNPYSLFGGQTRTRDPTIRETKIYHAYFIKTAVIQSDLVIANTLADNYCKCAAMGDALLLFDEIPHSNLISWNLMISGYNQSSKFEDAWRMFCRIHSSGLTPNQFTYGSVLSACTASQALFPGKQVYSLVIKNGFFSDGYVRTGMIDLFAKNCCFEDSLRLFRDVTCENVVCWNAIVAGAVRNRENFVALDLFRQMLGGFLVPNSFTFSSILTACTAVGDLEMGRGIHGCVLKCGAGDDVFVGTAIVDLYAKCGDIDEALKEFLWMPIHNVVSWTAIISGFVQNEDYISALQFFKQMREKGEEVNIYTITSVLRAVANTEMVREAIQIHSWILKTGFYSDSTVRDSLINMYSKLGAVDMSEVLFRETGNTKQVGTWASMLSAFAQNQSFGRTIEFFRRMLQEGLGPDALCCSSTLSIIGCLQLGRQIHCYIFKAGLIFDVSVACALFTMYSKCDSLEESYDIFEQINDKDEVSWTSMIAGFAEHGYTDWAFHLFQNMQLEEIRISPMTLSAVLTACSSLRSLQKGKEVHGYALRMGVAMETLVGGALVTMYWKCGALVSASQVFEKMPKKDQVSGASLLSGYAQNGYIEEAFLMLREWLMVGLEIDCFMISSLLSVGATLTSSTLGNQLHTYILKAGLHSDLSVGSSLVIMYSKCGSIDDARKVFDWIEKPDLVTWTSMIVGYAQHGKGAEALGLYKLMRKEGTIPDSVTFVGVLSACSHNGLVEEGLFHLNSMTRDYGIEPGPHHYACMVDLLGRSGRLRDAERFISDMPIEPDALVWGTLLGACRLHGDVELGRLAAERVLELDPGDAGAYISLSNICADQGNWEEVMKIRGLMKGTGIKKEPGWSSV